MGRYTTVYTEVEVDVSLEDFETEDLIEELQSRDETFSNDSKVLLTKIYENRRLGRDYQAELDSLIYRVLDKIV